MASKEQEFKTIEAIKKLVADLGEDSYIGFAMDGVFEMAEENINNDFACSWRLKAVAAEEKEKKAIEIANSGEKLISELKKENADLRDDLERETHKTADWIDNANERQETINEMLVKMADMQKSLDKKDLKIIRLKARLYDLLNDND